MFECFKKALLCRALNSCLVGSTAVFQTTATFLDLTVPLFGSMYAKLGLTATSWLEDS